MKKMKYIEPNWDLCPSRFVESIKLWLEHGCYPGSFVTGMLENDLKAAFGRFDSVNVDSALPEMRDLFKFIYNELPSGAWGSKDKMDEWHAMCREEEEG